MSCTRCAVGSRSRWESGCMVCSRNPDTSVCEGSTLDRAVLLTVRPCSKIHTCYHVIHGRELDYGISGSVLRLLHGLEQNCSASRALVLELLTLVSARYVRARYEVSFVGTRSD